MSAASVPTGNTFDKYGSDSPVVRRLMARFTRCFDELVAQARAGGAGSALDVGCGEGVLTERLAGRLAGPVVGVDLDDPGLRAHWAARQSDPESELGALLPVAGNKVPSSPDAKPSFAAMAAEDLRFDARAFDLVCAIEVLEHVSDPDAVLAEMARVSGRWLLVSVPREPLWRVLNVARGSYLSTLGNTPGHLQHFGARSIVAVVARHAEVVAVRAPLPWTMVLARVG